MMDKWIRFRLQWLASVVGLCLLPSVLAILGVDFTSSSLAPEQAVGAADGDESLTTENLFYLLAGALHHALLEWTAVSLALVAATVSIFHYRVFGDVTVPVVGMAVLAAGGVDAFHTLAATRLIESGAANADFIPFTWALSRIFNASVMIVAAGISLWLHRRSAQTGPAAVNGLSERPIRFLLLMAAIFLALAYLSVHLAATSESLPQTMFPSAYISRPFDVLPLALFLLGGTLYWVWYQQKHTLAAFALVISIIPQIATQLHMAFGSTALFDHHFNVAHGLKVVAYAAILFGLLFDFIVKAQRTNTSTRDSSLADNTVLFHVDVDELEVGRASRPLQVSLPIMAFFLATEPGCVKSDDW